MTDCYLQPWGFSFCYGACTVGQCGMYIDDKIASYCCQVIKGLQCTVKPELKFIQKDFDGSSCIFISSMELLDLSID